MGCYSWDREDRLLWLAGQMSCGSFSWGREDRILWLAAEMGCSQELVQRLLGVNALRFANIPRGWLHETCKVFTRRPGRDVWFWLKIYKLDM